MSITDELRKYTCRLSDEAARKSEHGFSPIAMVLEGIADRIDAEHESACAEAYGNGVMSVPIALDESAWVKLPVDADGEVIHVGDVMKTERFGVVEVEGFIHNAIAFNVYDPQPARICTVPANQCRHYHAPTVEDVLTKFGIDWEYEDNCEDRAALLAEYASKLRLAGDAE